MTGFRFPRVYPILDSSMIPAEGRATFLVRLGRELADAGVGLMEYRNKDGAVEEILADAGGLRAAMPEAKLILDDRAELVERVGFDGVHVDDGDMTPAEARLLLGPERIIGTFAGNMELIPGVLSQPADYFAVGPVFRTITKKTSLPSIGTEGVRRLRAAAGPGFVLTAAGGIHLENAAAVLEAGASTVAVVGAIFRKPDPAGEFRRWMALLG